MFVALRKSGEQINLLEQWGKQMLVSLREKEKFFCPICHHEVKLKLGESKKYHFAHKKTANCTIELENESYYHLQGKELLYHWLRRQGMSVELERYIPSIQQRPDLLISYNGMDLALEYQCSSIPASQFIKRTQAYWKERIRVLWVLGGNHFKRHSAHWLKISSFQALFTQYDAFPYLLYFCPNTAFFLKCAPLIPFSSSTVFSHVTVHSLPSTTIHSVFETSSLSLEWLQKEWNQKKKQWRMQGLYALGQQNRNFYQLLYEHRISPSCFPPEAAIPLPSLFSVQTPALVWQCYLLLHVLGPLQIGQYFSIQQLYNYMERQSYVKQRLLPYFPPSFFKRVTQEYVQFLCYVGNIEHLGGEKYRKCRTYYVPTTEEEACQKDSEIMGYALQLFTEQAVYNMRGSKKDIIKECELTYWRHGT
ncbi:competence protein CoiA [Microbacteriaceae bacterium 4G12]